MSDIRLYPLSRLTSLAQYSDKAMLVVTEGTGSAADAADFRDAISVLGYSPESTVCVNSVGDDEDRGDSLVAAYAAAKLLTPNGDPLSNNNRVAVVIPPGKYKLSASLILDTDFVDLMALFPEKPSRRKNTDVDPIPDGAAPFDPTLGNTSYRPSGTVVYSEVDYTSTIVQTCDNVRLRGFTISHFGLCVDFFTIDGDGKAPYTDAIDWAAFLIGDGSSNELSQYDDMYFWSYGTAFTTCSGCRGYLSFSGTWTNCIANGASFRCGYGDRISPVTVFSAQMYDCEGGQFSFIGDFMSDPFSHTAENCRLERCKCLGVGLDATEPGSRGFAGCNGYGVALDNTCVFVECESGDYSFGMGNTNGGTFIRCRGGNFCFGAHVSLVVDLNGAPIRGNFSGYAEDCIAGANSFSSGNSDGGGAGFLSGTLIRCTVSGNTYTTRARSATIRDSRITVAETGIHAITVMDAATVISNSEIIVLQGGTGLPIRAGTGPITSTANAGGFSRVTSTAHGLKIGDAVTFSGSTNMNGTFNVTAITHDTFTTSHTFVSNNTTGTWVAGSSATGSVAAYHCSMNNASNDADGLASNVANLVASPNNVVSNAVK